MTAGGMLDLWTLLVENTFGGFWLAVICLAVLLFVILAYFGRMSMLTSMNYVFLFLMTMSIGYGFRLLTVVIGILTFVWLYLAWRMWLGE